METTQHTKGEWNLKGDSIQNQIRCKDGHILANIDPLNVYGKVETEANAKLMVAAPDMLDALYNIIRTMQNADIRSVEDAMHIIAKIGNRANSVIKKATE